MSQTSPKVIHHPDRLSPKSRDPFEYKQKQKDLSNQHAKDSRFHLLMEKFRKISMDEEFSEDDLPIDDFNEGIMGVVNHGFVSSQQFDSSQQFEMEDWGETPVAPTVDVRHIDYNQPGLPCPYCKKDWMHLLNPAVGELHCSCSFTLTISKSVERIKANMQMTITDHAMVCNQSPRYETYKNNVVLSCDFCKLGKVVS